MSADEQRVERIMDLVSYTADIRAKRNADVGTLIELLAVKMWTLEQNQRLILDRLDELRRRMP